MASVLKNRKFWLGALLLGVVAILLFDRNNIFERRKLRKQIDRLEDIRDYYLERIRQDSLIIRRLETDDSYLERYARENYLMRGDSDKVYIVKEQ